MQTLQTRNFWRNIKSQRANFQPTLHLFQNVIQFEMAEGDFCPKAASLEIWDIAGELLRCTVRTPSCMTVARQEAVGRVLNNDWAISGYVLQKQYVCVHFLSRWIWWYFKSAFLQPNILYHSYQHESLSAYPNAISSSSISRWAMHRISSYSIIKAGVAWLKQLLWCPIYHAVFFKLLRR